jgi:hypothetical protein
VIAGMPTRATTDQAASAVSAARLIILLHTDHTQQSIGRGFVCSGQATKKSYQRSDGPPRCPRMAAKLSASTATDEQGTAVMGQPCGLMHKEMPREPKPAGQSVCQGSGRGERPESNLVGYG